MAKENRYVVTMDMYVYGKDDYMARVEAHKLVDKCRRYCRTTFW